MLFKDDKAIGVEYLDKSNDTLHAHCNKEVNYTNSILRDVLSIGLADHDIQLDLLSNMDQQKTLEVFRFIEAKEAGLRSASQLTGRSDTTAAASQYRKQKTQQPTTRTTSETYTYCGKKGHGIKSCYYNPFPSLYSLELKTVQFNN